MAFGKKIGFRKLEIEGGINLLVSRIIGMEKEIKFLLQLLVLHQF